MTNSDEGRQPTAGRGRERKWSLRRVVSVLLYALAVDPCLPPPKTPPPAGDPDLAQAMQMAANDLMRQLSPGADGTRTLTIDPLLDSKTGQQTNASNKVQQELTTALGNVTSKAKPSGPIPIDNGNTVRNVKVLPFDGAGAEKSKLLITGTLTTLPEAGKYKLSAALSDRQSGLVVAQAVVIFKQAGLDAAPTRFYTDSPSLVRDRSVDGYLRTAETPAGKPADPLYIEQVPTAALLADALTAYNAEKWEDALKLYKSALQRKDGQQLRTFNGIYLTNVQLGRMEDAEEAFGKIAALGLATNNLAVKLLFRPGGTDFWPDPKVNGVYPMWLRQIARAAQTADSCLNIVGHTSRSGTEQINERLSLSRATAIRDKLVHEVPGLAHKSRVSGLGYRENIVGTGADDASDALDRRVEFKVVACGA